MQIMRDADDRFTGVYLDTITTPTGRRGRPPPPCISPPGARTAWRTHPFGQTIYVTEGIGLCQREGGPGRPLVVMVYSI